MKNAQSTSVLIRHEQDSAISFNVGDTAFGSTISGCRETNLCTSPSADTGYNMACGISHAPNLKRKMSVSAE